jgi:hypothetical protein
MRLILLRHEEGVDAAEAILPLIEVLRHLTHPAPHDLQVLRAKTRRDGPIGGDLSCDKKRRREGGDSERRSYVDRVSAGGPLAHERADVETHVCVLFELELQ